MFRTRIKICGITRPEDGIQAVELGADAIGLVFYDPSPRAVSISMAQQITTQLPAFVSVVGLFVDAPSEVVSNVLSQVRIDLLQFHGDESAEYCDQFGRPYMKAFRVKDASSLDQLKDYPNASSVLLDSYKPGVPGGTGEAFNWDLIPKESAQSIVLAGGLTPENVQTAVQTVRPFAVDVSGGVEASKGIKDFEKMKNFIEGVRRADDAKRTSERGNQSEQAGRNQSGS